MAKGKGSVRRERQSRLRHSEAALSIPGRDPMLLALTWAAGSVDAISYLGLGHVFTAMMTGNTVLLGLALAQGEVWAVLRSIIALVGFAAGAAVSALRSEEHTSELQSQ